jgi:type I restriction enzyme S subunit
VGRINVADTRLILGRGLCGIRGLKTPSSYLLYALKNVFVEEDSMGNGAIFKAVTKKDVEIIPIIWRGEPLVRKFSAHVESLTNLIGILVRALETLRTTRDLLLPRLISGAIDVDSLNIQLPNTA